jgi:hypothetical protein
VIDCDRERSEFFLATAPADAAHSVEENLYPLKAHEEVGVLSLRAEVSIFEHVPFHVDDIFTRLKHPAEAMFKGITLMAPHLNWIGLVLRETESFGCAEECATLGGSFPSHPVGHVAIMLSPVPSRAV